ncbi:KIN17-like protein, partial [Sesamum angolense]
MPKNDFLTPKAIANRIKAKGLQKLRWYCQMCQKQCRDENGFKCHCMSESHQRQMQVFGQNPNRIIGGYSEEFESTFLEHMKRSHRFSRVAATVVYNEYISDRHHVHMNSTQWATLTEFVKYLGRTGSVRLETPKGWFITYIDRDSETLFKEKMKNKRIKADAVDEEKQEKEIQKQIERAEQMMMMGGNEKVGEEEGIKPRILEKNDGDGEKKIKLSLGLSKKNVESNEKRESSRLLFDEGESESKNAKRKREGENSAKNASVLDELMREEEKAKERSNRKDWLFEGIIVKVMSKALADKGYYKQKGVVRKIGGLVKIVNGAYRGEHARLLAVDTGKFCAKVQIEKGIYDGRVLKAVEYEDICKLAQSWMYTYANCFSKAVWTDPSKALGLKSISVPVKHENGNGFACNVDSRLFEAAQTGNAELLLDAIRSDPLILRKAAISSTAGDSALHIACLGHIYFVHEILKHGHVDVLKELVLAGVGSIEMVTSRGESALHLAVKNNKFDVLKVLIEHIESSNNLGDIGNTSLHLAAAKKQHEVIWQLVTHLQC